MYNNSQKLDDLPVSKSINSPSYDLINKSKMDSVNEHTKLIE